MTDLKTSYLGFDLKNPLVASSSPICESLDKLKQLEDVGVSAVVLHSLFEEQVECSSAELDQDLYRGTESFFEAMTYIPQINNYSIGPEKYLEHIAKAKENLNIPVIASLNGSTLGGWINYARLIEEAGADALELNVYYLASDPNLNSEQIENLYLKIVQTIVESIKIPVAVKLSHFFTSIPHLAKQLEASGVKALVLFNRFYQPDFDLNTLEVVPNLSLSSSNELRLRLRWVAILSDQLKLDFAITGGIHSSQDILKAMMAGAKTAMTTSALLRHGIGHAAILLEQLREWMELHEYSSIKQMQGSMSQQKVSNPRAYNRANYVRMLRTYSQNFLSENPLRYVKPLR